MRPLFRHYEIFISCKQIGYVIDVRLPQTVRQIVPIRNIASLEKRAHDPEDFVAKVAIASFAGVLRLRVQVVMVHLLGILIQLIHALFVKLDLICWHCALPLVLLLLLLNFLHLNEDVAYYERRLVFEAEEGSNEMVFLAEYLQLGAILQLLQLLIDRQLLNNFLKTFQLLECYLVRLVLQYELIENALIYFVLAELARHQERLQVLDEQLLQIRMSKEEENVVEEELGRVDVEAKLDGHVYCYLFRTVLNRSLVLAEEALGHSLAQLLQHVLYFAFDEVLHVRQQLPLADLLLVGQLGISFQIAIVDFHGNFENAHPVHLLVDFFDVLAPGEHTTAYDLLPEEQQILVVLLY